MAALGVRRGTFYEARPLDRDPLPAPSGYTFQALSAERVAADPLLMARGRAEPFAARMDEGHRVFGFLDAKGSLAAYLWLTVGEGEERTAPWAYPDQRFRVPAGRAYVWDCFTAPDHRGLGLYSAGLRQLRRVAGVLGADRVHIFVRRGNPAATRGVLSAGFRPSFRFAVVRAGRLAFVHREAAGPALVAAGEPFDLLRAGRPHGARPPRGADAP